MSPEQKDDGGPDQEVKTAAEIAEERAKQAATEAEAAEEKTEAQSSDADSAEPQKEEAPQDQPEEAAEGPPSVTVPDLVMGTVEMLVMQAWQKLGLVVDPQTKQIDKDIEQARLAIDCSEALVKQLDAHFSDEERRTFERVLADLKVNFVKQSGA